MHPPRPSALSHRASGHRAGRKIVQRDRMVQSAARGGGGSYPKRLSMSAFPLPKNFLSRVDDTISRAAIIRLLTRFSRVSTKLISDHLRKVLIFFIKMAHPRGFEPLASAFGGQRFARAKMMGVIILSSRELQQLPQPLRALA